MANKKGAVICSSALFVMAQVLALIALSWPQWVVHDFYGTAQLGLFDSCIEQQYKGQTRTVCGLDQYSPPGAWTVTAVFIIFGCISLMVASFYAFVAFSQLRFLDKAKWYAFLAATLFALASLIFPIGFDSETVGGEAFKLPEHSSVGISYVLFVVSLLLVFLGELAAMKIIFPE